jgi:hypothetical protein
MVEAYAGVAARAAIVVECDDAPVLLAQGIYTIHAG